MRSLIAARWEDVGVQLLSEEHQKEINIIKANHHGDVEKCCSRLFTIWSQRQPHDVTWRALIEAIRNAKLTNEAYQLEQMLVTSTGMLEMSQYCISVATYLLHGIGNKYWLLKYPCLYSWNFNGNKFGA